MPASIGIDLGTSNSCVATIDAAGKPRIVASAQGRRTLPSVVAFGDGGKVLTGDPARRQAVTAPRSTVFAAKRLMGRRFADPEVMRLAQTLPYAVVAAENGDAVVDLGGGRRVSPAEIASYILGTLAEGATAELGPLGEAVVTVPAHFDAAQRQATMDAAEIAGLRVRRLLAEPTAAALGYGVHRGAPARIAVCDLGGGTFDVSLLRVEDGAFEVLSTHGDLLLGGDDVDRRIVEIIGGEIRARHGLDPTGDPTLLARLRDEAVRVKHALSDEREVRFHLPFLTMQAGKPVDFARPVGRAELDGWAAGVLDRLVGPCRAALEGAGLAPRDVDQVLLVGGATRMPAVQDTLARIFGRPPAKTANPDEAVAIGAATLCAVLDGLLEGVVLLDVTAHGLGVHAGGGRFEPVIARNATLPARESRVIATTLDGQRELAVEVYEGDSPDLRGDRLLGTFVLGDLPDAPAGEVVVLVDFTLDVDGLLHVDARELATGQRAGLKLRPASGLARREVRRLAEAHRGLR